LQSSTPYTPASAFPSLGATSASRTSGPARVAGLDDARTAVGVYDEEDADFPHPLGSAAVAPAPSLERRRSTPESHVGCDSDSEDDMLSDSDDDTGSIALSHGSGSDFGLIPRLPALQRISATMTFAIDFRCRACDARRRSCIPLTGLVCFPHAGIAAAQLSQASFTSLPPSTTLTPALQVPPLQPRPPEAMHARPIAWPITCCKYSLTKIGGMVVSFSVRCV